MRWPVIRTAQQLIELINEIGFLPFFQNSLSGYSVEDCTPPELMFVKGTEGPWEWREELLESRACVYGKFFAGRTGWISLDWFPELSNYRRGGYDFDARWDDGLVPYQDKCVYDLIERQGLCPSPTLRRLADAAKSGGAFERSMTRLQMRTYVLPARCLFARNRQGEKYGYGTASFDLAERWLGVACCTGAYHKSPEDSYAAILSHLERKFGGEAVPQLEKLLRMP